MKRLSRQKHSRQQHAICRQDIHNKRQTSGRRILRWTTLILLLSLTLWGWQVLKNPDNFPIYHVQLQGEYPHIHRAVLEELISPYVDSGLFDVDIQGIRETLMALPWIKEITVSRRWPHDLIVTITEQKPVAQWGDSALMNSNGEIFSPKKASFPHDLPMLEGPEGKEKDVLTLYQTVTQVLKPLNLSLIRLNVSDREAVTLNLSNGIELILGKQDIMLRLQRFVGVYDQVFANKAKVDDVVDMRYTNGMALEEKEKNEWERN